MDELYELMYAVFMGVLCIAPALSYVLYRAIEERERESNQAVRIIVNGTSGYLCSKCGNRYNLNVKYCPCCGAENIYEVEIRIPIHNGGNKL